MTHTDSTPRTADVIVIGGGPVGENAAQYAIAGTDMTALIVEGELLGGECSYYACIPSKALLRPIEVARTTSTLPGVSTAEVQRAELLARRDTWVSGYDDSGQVQWAEGSGLPVVRGHGRLTGQKQVEVTGADGDRTVLQAEVAVILATGSAPSIPAPYREVHPWTSRDATGVREVPGHIAIIGGGVVACEAATWMRALGAEVTMLVRGDALLRSSEPFAGQAVAEGLRHQGVEVSLGTDVSEVRRDDARETGLGRIHGGTVHLTTSAGQLDTDEVLVATGRHPRLEDVGLDAVGLRPEDVTGEKLPDWLHVVGDASGEAPLTHWGKYRSRVIGERIAAMAAGRDAAPVPPNVPVPQVVFTDPQVAQVGRTEDDARKDGAEVVTSQIPYGSAAGTSLLRDEVPGQVKIVVDADTGRLLGASFVGPEAAELVHAATIAIVGEVPVGVLRHAVPSFPTSSELWLQLLESLPQEVRGLG